MTNKEKVLSRWSDAVCKREWPSAYCVLAGSGLWGLGDTESEAWADAVRKIEQHEGRKLPVKGIKCA